MVWLLLSKKASDALAALLANDSVSIDGPPSKLFW
jgi:hypothetical protein